jgi:uncharacterized protein (DUF305 family)
MHIQRVMWLAPIVAAGIAAGGLLAGCGGTTATNSATAPPPAERATHAANLMRHNQDDVVFLQKMLAHHVQTGTMSDLAHSKATLLKVKAIALRIKAAQDQQIIRIHNLLGGWDAPASSGGSSSDQVPGMLSDQQIQQLKTATGNAFDQLFLQLMITHQQGAIQMSQTELAQGSDAQAHRLAQDIITGQQVEINQMQKLIQPS